MPAGAPAVGRDGGETALAGRARAARPGATPADNDQNAQVFNQLQMEMLGMRGQFERNQIMLEQYDRVRPYLSLVLVCVYRS